MYAVSWSGKSGLSSPHFARSAATNSGVRCGFFVARSGEPGIIRNSTKLRITIADDRDERSEQLARDVATAHRSALQAIRRGPRAGDPRR